MTDTTVRKIRFAPGRFLEPGFGRLGVEGMKAWWRDGACRREWRAGFVVVLMAFGSAGCAGVPIEDLIRSLPLPSETERREPVLSPVTAQRSIEVHWRHPAPASVERFNIYWGIEQGEYLAVEEVMPQRQRDGTFLATLRVPANQTVLLAVSAVGAGGESPRSNLGVCEPRCRRAKPMGASRPR